MSPKQDALLGRSPSGLWRAALDPRHPEASLSALFARQW